MRVQNRRGEGDGHVHIDVTNLSPFHKVPGCVVAVATHHLQTVLLCYLMTLCAAGT